MSDYRPAHRANRQTKAESRKVELWQGGQFVNTLNLTDQELTDLKAVSDGVTDYGIERWIVPSES